jgi:hypothetical protein
MQLPHQVDGFTRHADETVRPPVPQKIVELGHGGGNVAPVTLIGDGERFAGVDVVEPQSPNVSGGCIDSIAGTASAQ